MGFLSLNVTNHATIIELALEKEKCMARTGPHEHLEMVALRNPAPERGGHS